MREKGGIEKEIDFKAETKSEQEKKLLDFSKCQMQDLLKGIKEGYDFEWESYSPYLADHNTATGELLTDEMPKDDKIGIEIAKMLKEKFPNARMISLYDEYNTNLPDSSDIFGKPNEAKKQLELPEEIKNIFRKSIEKYLRKEGVIKDKDKEGENYLFVSESSKTKKAQELVDRLRERGAIRDGKNGEIFFDNGQESFILKTKAGRWMCEALDASAFLDPKNLEIIHLVILPDHFKKQQDRVWEMLKTLGHKPTNYHNIFYNPEGDPQKITERIKQEIEQAEKAVARMVV